LVATHLQVAEEMRMRPDAIVAYQIQIVASGRSDSCVRVATYALRGFLEHVLERADAKLAKLPRPRQPKRLPEGGSSSKVWSLAHSQAT
jgi:hypothetical protein